MAKKAATRDFSGHNSSRCSWGAFGIGASLIAVLAFIAREAAQIYILGQTTAGVALLDDDHRPEEAVRACGHSSYKMKIQMGGVVTPESFFSR